MPALYYANKQRLPLLKSARAQTLDHTQVRDLSDQPSVQCILHILLRVHENCSAGYADLRSQRQNFEGSTLQKIIGTLRIG